MPNPPMIQVGNLIRLDHDSSSRLLRSAMKHLRQQQKYLPKLQPFPSFLKADGSCSVELQVLNSILGFWSLKIWWSCQISYLYDHHFIIMMRYDGHLKTRKTCRKHSNKHNQTHFCLTRLSDQGLVIDPNDIYHKRHWSPPLTHNVNCQSRGFSVDGGHLRCLGAKPLVHILQKSVGPILEAQDEDLKDPTKESEDVWVGRLRFYLWRTWYLKFKRFKGI